jgi:vacuolar protein sorting-associated protein 11
MAQKLGADISQQNVIYRRYGDYLYQKQDYDTAMQQYLKAIDNTEPSQVIRKVRHSDCLAKLTRAVSRHSQNP